MNEYEKYRLQWMLDHDYSLPDLLERLSDIAMNENLDEIQNPRVMLNEAFERLEYEQGFDNKEIWLCKDEWEHDLYSSNEYSLTDAGKTKVKHFIEDCRIKQDSILKAGLDTAKETTLPSVEDILCNVEDMVDEDGKYTNAWNITDNYLSDPLEMNKDDDFVIHSNEQVKDVLIGSTPKLGAGTNIQERMIAIHHVDVPWRASDIEQQNGRAFRQGNMYNEIYEFRYVTKKSFDAYSWQMVETKSSYVTQLLEGTGDTREFEEDTQNSFSYAEVKAIASGNPIIKEKFEVDNEVKRLETMRRSWQKKKLQAQDDVALLPDRIETEKKYLTILAEECEYFKDEIEANNLRDMEHFTFYDVNGNEYHDLKEAWDAIQECTKGYKLSDYKENKFVGRFMKADVLIGLGLAGEGIVIKMKTPLRTINVDSVNPVGRVNFNRMYKRINDIRYSLNKTIETIQNYEGNLKIAKEMVNKPFELQDELTSARNRQKEINKILDTSGNENSKVVVEDDLEEERNESCMEL